MSVWRRFRFAVVCGFLAALCGVLLAADARTNNDSRTQTGQSPAVSDFKIIAERNIFNPKRYARSSTTRRDTPRTNSSPSETLALTGTMAYEKGWFAFFEGSRTSHNKVVKREDEIAGLKVLRVMPEAVLLASGTNRLELEVGQQLKRRDEGPWRSGGQAELAVSAPVQLAPPPTRPSAGVQAGDEPEGPTDFIRQIIDTALGGTPPPPPPPGAPVGSVQATPAPGGTSTQTTPAPAASQEEVLRRLMQRREQEMN